MKRSLWGFLLDSILWSVTYFVLSFLALATLAAVFMVQPDSPFETYVVCPDDVPMPVDDPPSQDLLCGPHGNGARVETNHLIRLIY